MKMPQKFLPLVCKEFLPKNFNWSKCLSKTNKEIENVFK